MHGTERVRGQRAHHIVDLPAEHHAGVSGTDRYRDNKSRRMVPTHGGDSGSHGGAGRETVVDKDHHSVPDNCRSPTPPVFGGPAVQFAQLAKPHCVEVSIRNAKSGNNYVIRDHLDLVTDGGDGAHRQLRLPWHAELAHDQHIEPRAQCFGDLRGDRHPAARQSEHDHIVAARVLTEQRRQRPAGSGPVGEPGPVSPEAHPSSQPLVALLGNRSGQQRPAVAVANTVDQPVRRATTVRPSASPHPDSSLLGFTRHSILLGVSQGFDTEQDSAFVFGPAAPDAIRFLNFQGMSEAIRDGGTTSANRFGPRDPLLAGGVALLRRMKEP